MPRPKPPTGGWEAENQRLTFYCPHDLALAIQAEVATTRRSKTQVIVDALRAQLLDEPTDDAQEATP